MSKTKTISELTNLIAIALRHRIGSIVNENEIYSQKYARDAEVLMNEARKISAKENWNIYDKKKIAGKSRKKLRLELESKPFLNEEKFKILDRELNRALKELGLLD